MRNDKYFITAEELGGALGISRTRAYNHVAQMNAELESQGYRTVPGMIPITYVREKYYGFDFEEIVCNDKN